MLNWTFLFLAAAANDTCGKRTEAMETSKKKKKMKENVSRLIFFSFVLWVRFNNLGLTCLRRHFRVDENTWNDDDELQMQKCVLSLKGQDR